MHQHRAIPFGITAIAAAGLVGTLAAPAPADGLDRRWTVAAHGASIGAVAFSPDGLLAASASLDGSAKVWRVSDGELVRTFAPSGGFGLRAVAFAPDGASLLAAGSGGTYRWRLADGALLVHYMNMETGYGLAFSPDGETLAVGGTVTGADADVMLYRFDDGTQLARLKGQHFHYVFAVAYSPDGSTVFAAEGDPFFENDPGVVRVWDVATQQDTRVLAGHAGRVAALALAPDGVTLASGSVDQTIRLWNSITSAALGTWTGHTGEVNSLAFAPDGATLVSSGADATVRQWDVANGTEIRTLTGHVGPVASVAVSPDGARILSGAGDGPNSDLDASMRLWNANDGTPLRTFTQFPAVPQALVVARDQPLCAVVTSEAVELRSLLDGALLRSFSGGYLLWPLAIAPDGAHVAASNLQDEVQIWNTATGVREHTLITEASTVYALAYSPDGALLASTSCCEPTRIWNTATGELVRELVNNTAALEVTFSSDGTMLATLLGESAYVWRVADGALLHTLHHGTDVNTRPDALAWSPAGDVVATSGSGAIKLWAPSTGALVRTIPSVTQNATDLAFSPDGAVLISSRRNGDRVIRFWRVADGSLLYAMDEDTGTNVTDVAFSADNRQILFLRSDATLVAGRNPLGPGVADANADGVVDAHDHATFADCLSGPGASPAPAVASPYTCGVVFDADNDRDVDIADAARVQALAGP
ncbi:MAG: hypothetical protein H6816_12280 [Phycisphaerales bacterium]|nr:hypothetical protein [Phycisphaerales bacterium]